MSASKPVVDNESLRSLKKSQLVEIIIGLREEREHLLDMDSKLDKLNEKIDKISSELVISKTVNSLLSARVIDLEKRMAASEQYSRRECLEIYGIPANVKIDHLEDQVIKIFKTINVDVPKDGIQACHRIGKSEKSTIIKLSDRKHVLQLLKNKKLLRNVDPIVMGLPNNTKVYINESLCKPYRDLWYKVKDLWKQNIIFNFFTSNGTVKLRKSQLGSTYTINHVEDLKNLFPDVNFA